MRLKPNAGLQRLALQRQIAESEYVPTWPEPWDLTRLKRLAAEKEARRKARNRRKAGKL